jgi:hypothetical protein
VVEALGVLGQNDPETNVPVLVRLMRQGDGAIRAAAVAVLCRLDQARAGIAAPYLRGAMHDRVPAVRAAAAECGAPPGSPGSAAVVAGESTARATQPPAPAVAVPRMGHLRALLGRRSERVRTEAVWALGRLTERMPEAETHLEKALRDPARDVRMAAVQGLGAVWARTRAPREVGAILTHSETDAIRRLVALRALVRQAGTTVRHDAEAKRVLAALADKAPPLARLTARVGLAFIDAPVAAMDVFLDKFLGE